MTVKEMITFHALVLGMTLQPLPNKKHYWMSGEVGTVIFPDFGKHMSRNRFQEIKRNFHLRSNQMRDSHDKKSGEYKLWQTSQFASMLKTNFQKYYYPGRVITIDERTIPIRNRMCPVRVYNPSKPYKFGMEIFTLCDSISFYCYNFIVYDKVPKKGLHTSVVLDLCRVLPADVGYDIVLDRGFTSPLLLQELKKMGHTATGTVVSNRKNLPKISHGFSLEDDAPRGQFKALVCRKNEQVALIWKDKKPVYFLSTSKGNFFCFLCAFLILTLTISGLELKNISRRLYNPEKEFEVSIVKCPEICLHYNKYKDSVD